MFWVLAAGILLCSWCSLLSGVGGWMMGYDLGKREMQAALLPESGVLITRVERDSPAARAGLSRGDMITALNGVAIQDVVDLRDELLNYQPGERVLISYRHDLGDHGTYVTLDSYPGRTIPYLGIYFTARAESPADL